MKNVRKEIRDAQDSDLLTVLYRYSNWILPKTSLIIWAVFYANGKRRTEVLLMHFNSAFQ